MCPPQGMLSSDEELDPEDMLPLEGMVSSDDAQDPEDMLPPQGMVSPDDAQDPEDALPRAGMVSADDARDPEDMLPPQGTVSPDDAQEAEDIELRRLRPPVVLVLGCDVAWELGQLVEQCECGLGPSRLHRASRRWLRGKVCPQCKHAIKQSFCVVALSGRQHAADDVEAPAYLSNRICAKAHDRIPSLARFVHTSSALECLAARCLAQSTCLACRKSSGPLIVSTRCYDSNAAKATLPSQSLGVGLRLASGLLQSFLARSSPGSMTAR